MAIHPRPLELRPFHVPCLGSDREPERFSFTFVKLRWVGWGGVRWSSGAYEGGPHDLQLPPDPVRPPIQSPPTPY